MILIRSNIPPVDEGQVERSPRWSRRLGLAAYAFSAGLLLVGVSLLLGTVADHRSALGTLLQLAAIPVVIVAGGIFADPVVERCLRDMGGLFRQVRR